MIVRGWQVDGFGALSGFAVEDLGPGLTVVAGPNEAGKSTLLAFLRFCLFGFPRPRGGARHEPLRGGRHGGRLALSEGGRDGVWWVERYTDRRLPAIVAPDGTGAEPSELARLLGGADAGVFAAVFAFGLAELSSLASLTDQGVRDQIFSAGITGAGADVRQALQRLETEAQALLRPRGHSRIQELLVRIEQNRRDLAAARQAADAYPSLLQRQMDAGAGVAGLAGELAALRLRERHRRRLLEVWPLWQRCAATRARADAMRDPGPFPPDGETRLEALQAVRQKARKAVLRLRQESEGLATRPRLSENVSGAIVTLAAQAALQRQRLDDLPSMEAELRQLRVRRGAAIAEMGPEWDEARMGAADASVSTLEGVAAWGDRLRQAAEDLRAAEALSDAAEVNLAATRSGLEALRVPFPSLQAWERAGDAVAARVVWARGGVWLLGGGVAFALAGLALWALGHAAPAAGGGAVAVALCVWGRRGLGLRGAELALAYWQRQEAAVRERDALERQAAILERTLDERRALTRRTAAAKEHLERAWAEACSAAGVPVALRPEGVRAFVQALQRARELDAAVKAASARRVALEKALAAWEARARSAARMAGGPQETGAALVSWVLDAEARVRREREEALLAEQLDARLAEAEQALAELDGQWVALLAAAGLRSSGASAAEAGEAEAFRAQGARARQYREAGEVLAVLEDQLATALGEGAAAQALRVELQEGGVAGWEADLERLEAETARCEQEQLAAARAEREAELEREALERAADIARLAAEAEGLRTELADALCAYRTNTVAQALLRGTLTEFMAARQPDVLRVASGALAGITAGRYARVVQDERGDNLAVLDQAGRRLEPEWLSRGTQEQLYLALRLGLAASFARRSSALPVIMDDVLVNFDPQRASQTARFLAAFARGHAGQDQGQVLVFTCHPDSVRALREADPECRVVDMPGPWARTQREAAAARDPGPARRRRS